MPNTVRITLLQADKLKLQELLKSGNVDPQQCKGMIKMLDYKIQKLHTTNKQPPFRVAKFLEQQNEQV